MGINIAAKRAELSMLAYREAHPRQTQRMATQRQRFEAASESVRIAWMTYLESRLASATQASDADEVYKLVVKAAAWLSALCAQSAASHAILVRLCRLLLRMLHFLDLDDDETRGLVQCPCAYIASVVSGADVFQNESSTSRISRKLEDLKRLTQSIAVDVSICD